MEQALLATLSILATLVLGFLWGLKFTARKLFGKEGTEDHGLLGSLIDELKENTESIRKLSDYQKDHARAQHETNKTLQQLLRLQQEQEERKHG